MRGRVGRGGAHLGLGLDRDSPVMEIDGGDGVDGSVLTRSSIFPWLMAIEKDWPMHYIAQCGSWKRKVARKPIGGGERGSQSARQSHLGR
uniref:Uncharacterized protein n=1 Tax=Arundo donax TaxID=35708 RepID=A0A0A9AJ32_ARUDO